MKRRKHQKFRSRGGIRLPAAITLCLALSLLFFPGRRRADRTKGTDRSGSQQRLCHPRNGARVRLFCRRIPPRCTRRARLPQRGMSRRKIRLQRAPMCPRPTPRTTIRCCRPLTRLPRSPSTTRPRMTWMRQTVWPQTSIFPLMEMGRRCLSITHTAAKATRRMPLFRIHRPRPSARPIPIIM